MYVAVIWMPDTSIVLPFAALLNTPEMAFDVSNRVMFCPSAGAYPGATATRSFVPVGIVAFSAPLERTRVPLATFVGVEVFEIANSTPPKSDTLPVADSVPSFMPLPNVAPSVMSVMSPAPVDTLGSSACWLPVCLYVMLPAVALSDETLTVAGARLVMLMPPVPVLADRFSPLTVTVPVVPTPLPASNTRSRAMTRDAEDEEVMAPAALIEAAPVISSASM